MRCTGLQTEVVTLAPDELRSTASAYHQAVHPGLSQAAAVLAAGDVVAIPTETVYGLAANALSADAVSRVYAAKNRPADNPLIVHVSSLDMLASLYPPGWTLPPIYEAVVRDQWPGPLTILLPRSPLVPDVVTCGQPTMAVRMPAHPVALALIAACGFPLAAPSANSSGRPSPTLARHVLADLGGRVPLILDGGACTCGVESTVLDGLRHPPAILRPGGVTQEQLTCYPGLEGLLLYRRDFVDPQLEAAPSTPGMKYRHYSPSAPVLLLDPGEVPPVSLSDEDLTARLRKGAEALLAELGSTWPRQQVDAAGDGSLGVETGAPVKEVVGILRTSCPGLRPGPLPRKSGADVGCGQEPSEAVSNMLSSKSHGPTAEDKGSAPAGGEGRGQAEHEGPAPSQQRERDISAAAEARLSCYEYVLGHVSRPAEVASELFAALRHMDEVGVAVIVVEGVRDAGAGVAVMNRLRKAASRVVAV